MPSINRGRAWEKACNHEDKLENQQNLHLSCGQETKWVVPIQKVALTVRGIATGSFPLESEYEDIGSRLVGCLGTISAGCALSFPHERVDARGPFLLPEPLYQARLFHRLDGGMAFLFPVADAGFHVSRHLAGIHSVQTSRVLRLHFVGLFALGQSAILETARPADVVWPVHVISGGLDLRRSICHFR